MSIERTEPPSVDHLTEARRAIEAVLLVATDPTPVQLLAQLVELPVDVVQSMCEELAAGYEEERRGFQLVAVAGGWRYQTHPDTHAYVERFALEGIPNRLSSAALETLAIVAYKQPISRAQIGAIRGVNVDGVLRTLVQRGYVDEHGRDDGPGQATLFGTTPFFLEKLGLMSLEDLPALGEFVPSAEVLEALEHTLRVDGEPEPDPELAPTDENGDSGEVEATETIDLTDGAATNGHATNDTATSNDTAMSNGEAPVDGEATTNGSAPADGGVPVDGDAADGEAVGDEAVTGDDAPTDGTEVEPSNNGSTNGSAASEANGATHEVVAADEPSVDQAPVDDESIDAMPAEDGEAAQAPADAPAVADEPDPEVEVEADQGPEAAEDWGEGDDGEFSEAAVEAVVFDVVSRTVEPITTTPAVNGNGNGNRNGNGHADGNGLAHPADTALDADAPAGEFAEADAEVEHQQDDVDDAPAIDEGGDADGPEIEAVETEDLEGDDVPQADPADEVDAGQADPVGEATDGTTSGDDERVESDLARDDDDHGEPDGLTDDPEVAADPQAESATGTIATGTAGADDARFPGPPGDPPPPDDPAVTNPTGATDAATSDDDRAARGPGPAADATDDA